MRNTTLYVALVIFGTTSQCWANGSADLSKCDADDFACHRIVEQIIKQRDTGGKNPASEVEDRSSNAQRSSQSAPTPDQLIAIHKMARAHKCKDKADWASIYSAGKDRTVEDLLCRVGVLEERVRELEDAAR